MPVYNETRLPENELHALLLKAVPINEYGNKSIATLAKLIPCRRWSVNKWIRAGRIPPDKALRVVEISKAGEPYVDGGRVTTLDFDPFVYKPRASV